MLLTISYKTIPLDWTHIQDVNMVLKIFITHEFVLPADIYLVSLYVSSDKYLL